MHGAITEREKKAHPYLFYRHRNASKANCTKRTDVAAVMHCFHSQFSLTEKYLQILDFDQITCAEEARYFMRFQDKLLSIPSGKKKTKKTKRKSLLVELPLYQYLTYQWHFSGQFQLLIYLKFND